MVEGEEGVGGRWEVGRKGGVVLCGGEEKERKERKRKQILNYTKRTQKK